MSKIQTIQPNYQNSRAMNKKNSEGSILFKGTSTLGEDATKIVTDFVVKDVKKTIEKKQGVIGWLSRKLDNNDGEVQNQSINAIFTGTLAPLFIAYNPISTQDDKTKKYTALRQPISALIAISGGLAMTNVIDKFMSTVGSEGHLPFGLDMRIAPDKLYLKPTYKTELAKAMKENKFADFAEKYKSEEWDNDQLQKIKSGNISKAEKKEMFSSYMNSVKNDRVNLFATLVSEDPKNISIDEASKEIFILDKSSKDGKKVLAQNIPNLTTKTQLEAFVNVHNFHQRTFGDFMQKQFKLEFHDDGTLKRYVLDSQLKKIKAMDFLREVGLVDSSATEEDLVRVLSELRENKQTKNQIRSAFRLGALKADGDIVLAKATGEQAARIGQMQMGEGFFKTEKMTLGHFFNRMGMDEKSLQELMNKKMADGFNVFTALFKEKKLKGFDPKTTIKTIGKQIMKNRAGRVGKDYDVFKTFVMIGFNLVTTAITCTALNWAYPRIVEALWPHLVKEDAPDTKEIKKEGGNK